MTCGLCRCYSTTFVILGVGNVLWLAGVVTSALLCLDQIKTSLVMQRNLVIFCVMC